MAYRKSRSRGGYRRNNRSRRGYGAASKSRRRGVRSRGMAGRTVRLVIEAPSPQVTTQQMLAERFAPPAPRKAQF